MHFPAVPLDGSALDAARLLADHGLPGLIVIDGDRRPVAVLPGPQLLQASIPRYVQDDPTLALLYSEADADRLCAPLAGKSVADLLPAAGTAAGGKAPPIVDADATVMEIASVMARTHSPVVAVTADAHRTDAPMIGVVTVSRLLAHLLPSA